ncbi:MAG: hypothetical protein E7016_07440 [Alphaproteobacteria bacterium]|nr:hypothetical protein [Alphaproteobacteria bacterium]
MRIINIVKEHIVNTLKLLLDFKWYVALYLLFYFILIWGYLNPPTENDAIFNSEYTQGLWYYINQEVYICNMQDLLIEFFLLFLIGTSNMKNHPTLAKLIFLSPILFLVLIWL